MSDIVVSIIMVAIVTVFVTRPRAAETIMRLSSFMAAAIKALLGADYE